MVVGIVQLGDSIMKKQQKKPPQFELARELKVEEQEKVTGGCSQNQGGMGTGATLPGCLQDDV